MECSPPGSSVQGISQARLLEWIAISSSRDRTRISCLGKQILHHCTIWEAPWLYMLIKSKIHIFCKGLKASHGSTFQQFLQSGPNTMGQRVDDYFQRHENLHLKPHQAVSFTWFSHFHNRAVRSEILTWGEGGPGHCYGWCAGRFSAMSPCEVLRGAFNGSQIGGIFKTMFLLTK